MDFNYLDEISIVDGYQYLLCSHCQTVRSSPFAIYRILPNTSAETFIAIGISIALEKLFEYEIPKVILVKNERDLPSLLRGYEVVEAANSSEIKRKLKRSLKTVLKMVKKTTWKPRKLPFFELSALTPSEEFQLLEKNGSEKNGKVPDIPMVSEYESLTRMQAIEKLLQENIGAVCHTDFVVRSLYGDLEPNIFKIVKRRVQSSLRYGKDKTYWSAVPEEPGCYTFDLEKLPLKKGKAKSKAKQKKRKPFVLPKVRRIPMLRAYEGKFLIDAISDFLEENQGTIFSVADIISGLYGDLDDQQLREIKSAVLNETSRGYRIGRFSRVPKKIGYYTWDMDTVKS